MLVVEEVERGRPGSMWPRCGSGNRLPRGQLARRERRPLEGVDGGRRARVCRRLVVAYRESRLPRATASTSHVAGIVSGAPARSHAKRGGCSPPLLLSMSVLVSIPRHPARRTWRSTGPSRVDALVDRPREVPDVDELGHIVDELIDLVSGQTVDQ